MDQKFPKSERLNSRKEIEQLFSGGQSFLVHPFRVLWTSRETNPEIPVKVVFSVPKRRFKNASDRNLIKRRCREAYRKENLEIKSTLLAESKAINLMLVYVANNKCDYSEIQLKIILILQRLAKIHG